MIMRLIKIVLFTSLLLYIGMVSAETPGVFETRQSQKATIAQPLPFTQSNDAQTQIQQAADHFDAFALQMPLVIKAKIDAFMKHGFRAILLDDPETKPGEVQMIQSLTDGLHHMGNALEDDMVNFQNNRQTEAGNDLGKIQQEYHSINPPVQQQKK